jgi:hypothetical protein
MEVLMKFRQAAIAFAIAAAFGAAPALGGQGKQTTEIDTDVDAGPAPTAQQLSQPPGGFVGVSPDTVRRAEQALQDAGYDPGTVDENWDQDSQRALMTFQNDQDLAATGQLDQATLAALAVDEEGQAAAGESGQSQAAGSDSAAADTEATGTETATAGD